VPRRWLDGGRWRCSADQLHDLDVDIGEAGLEGLIQPAA
jgi:hypothetical protein